MAGDDATQSFEVESLPGIGPQRYGDLQRDLGMGANVLATRLRELEEAGVLHRLPLHHNTRAYALTERGLALREVIVALRRWGAEASR